MSKAKTAKKDAEAAEVKVATKAKKTATKSKAKSSDAVGKETKKAAKAKPAKSEVKEKAPAKSKTAAKPAAETAPAPEPVAVAAPAPAPEPVKAPELKPVAAFSNSGLGIKMSSKKPVLSVAPGVLILGRPAVAKQETVAKPLERKLSKKELQDIKNILMEKRERLLAGMRRELALQKERAESKAADEVDKATDAYDEDLSFEIATANDMELEEIQVALEKIERGTYGQCEVCSTNISPSRLKVLPSATTCVSCRGQEELARRRDDSPNFNMLTAEDGDADGIES
ncbi:MAG: TraR/DksA C4-type zinc finger protein [Planctomycetes bacterium]|nr:TraR/DksA C4-type zinc finger protein [Planctomycetota bacterium]